MITLASILAAMADDARTIDAMGVVTLNHYLEDGYHA